VSIPQKSFVPGVAIALFVGAIVLFLMDNSAVGGAMVAIGAAMLTISASQKKNDNG
jgi:uncharacterized membrane protein